jgi:hypothetical protein
MIPKPGDFVTLDPWYEGRMLDEEADQFFGVPLKVVHVAADGPWLSVTVSEPRICTFYIAKKDGSWAEGLVEEGPALFMPAIDALAGAAMATSKLKVCDTDPEAQTCAKCGEGLNDPMPGVPIFRHCPVCEP